MTDVKIFNNSVDSSNQTTPVNAKGSPKTSLAIIVIIQAMVFLVIPSVFMRLVQGAASWVDIFYLILSGLGGIGIWIIVRNGRGKTGMPLWLGEVLGLLPLILMALASIFMMLFYLGVKYW